MQETRRSTKKHIQILLVGWQCHITRLFVSELIQDGTELLSYRTIFAYHVANDKRIKEVRLVPPSSFLVHHFITVDCLCIRVRVYMCMCVTNLLGTYKAHVRYYEPVWNVWCIYGNSQRTCDGQLDRVCITSNLKIKIFVLNIPLLHHAMAQTKCLWGWHWRNNTSPNEYMQHDKDNVRYHIQCWINVINYMPHDWNTNNVALDDV
jgi:hypothetical protein